MSCPLMKKPQRERGGSWFLSPSYYSLPGFQPYSLGSFAVPLTRTYPFIQAQAVSAISLLPASPLAALSAAAAPTQGGGSGSIFMAPGWAWQPPSSKDKVLRAKAGRSRGVGLKLEERFVLGRRGLMFLSPDALCGPGLAVYSSVQRPCTGGIEFLPHHPFPPGFPACLLTGKKSSGTCWAPAREPHEDTGSAGTLAEKSLGLAHHLLARKEP